MDKLLARIVDTDSAELSSPKEPDGAENASSAASDLLLTRNTPIICMRLDDRIASLFLDGQTLRQIADELGVTRNTIAGRVYRLRSRGVELESRRSRGRIEGVPNSRKNTVRRRRARFRSLLHKDPTLSKGIAVRSFGVPIYAHKEGECRFVLDKPWACDCHHGSRVTLCGNAVWLNTSWCEGHAAIVFRP